ncbi:MAG: HD domain-containing protein [Atopobiaceae bacterium]|nr:HD domain-containing protein [Atopobiaceae bacterium]
MSHLPTNLCVPDLPLELSSRAIAHMGELQMSGGLSPYATPDEASIRRDEDRDQGNMQRPAFVRDAEKIMHIPAYNRMSGKTQVFSFRANDDLCRRGLHVQLVARIARDLGRALGLNLDLIEAIALGHDIGHTPFGHAGERFLNNVYHARTGRWFFHNVQSVRVLDVLYGRNLSLQTLDGVICHNGEFEQQRFETSKLSSFDEFDAMVEGCWERGDNAIGHLRPMTLEGCVVRVSDIIAYVGKDRQDAIAAGLCDDRTFDDGIGGAYNSWALTAFTVDITEHSLGKDHLEMSEEGFAEMRRAKRENYEKIYGASEVNGEFSQDVAHLFEQLYDHELDTLGRKDTSAAIFKHHIEPLERYLAHYGHSYRWQDDPDQCVCDYISAMSDDYFMAACEELFPQARELFPRRSYFEGGVRA